MMPVKPRSDPVTRAAVTSLIDRLENTPDLLAHAAKVSCPSLFVCGDQEPSENYPADAFCRITQGPSEVTYVPESGHFYDGKENFVGKTVANWLGSQVAGQD
jgi:alpha/beta superfamily hydrolase